MILELQNITKSFEHPLSGKKNQVLSGISLQLKQGESIAIIGPSGSGKSTLLNIAGTLDHPSSGAVLIEDRNVASLNKKNLAHIRNTKIGFVFQLHHLLPQLNLIENVLLPLIPLTKDSLMEESTILAAELLDKVGLSNHHFHFPGQLSVGECQRAALVRALINKPPLLLADEPTGALDQINSATVGGLLVDFSQNFQSALLLVTHSEKLAASMQQVFVLENGKLLKQ